MAESNQTIGDIRGSIWRRWDPHIHTPGTVFNDQYGNQPETWEQFASRIELATPGIAALGVTDYLRLDSYRKVCELKSNGRLANVDLIFPNVEMRFGIETSKGSAVNVHLLFSPDDPDHASEIERFLTRLNFRYLEDVYACTRLDLIRLGRKHKEAALPDDAAFAAGANQFKVNFNQLQDEWKNSKWVRENCLVAVAASENDGTSGLRDPNGSLEALRKSIEAFAHIIFSSNNAQIDFWLGRRGASIADLELKWGGMKPCLHGSDAHSIVKVGNPDGGRLCWIKGDPTFEALRQACMEPGSRVSIGKEPPRGSLGSRTIQSVAVTNADWLTPSVVELNPGLVAIIGARGSGKTALAELLAAGGLAVSSRLSPKSFLVRAREHLGGSSVELQWEDGDKSGNDLTATDIEDILDSPRVQYLSQQFVDELCSAEGATDALVEEMHKVVFNAQPLEQRESATTFQELLDLRSAESRSKRSRCQQQFDAASRSLTDERQLKADLLNLEKQRLEFSKEIAQDEQDRKRLIGKGQEARAKRQQDIVDALDQRRRNLERAQLRGRTLRALRVDVEDFRGRRFEEILSELREERSDAGLSSAEWELFALTFRGDVDALLSRHIKAATNLTAEIGGEPVVPVPDSEQQKPLIPEGAVLGQQTVSVLQAESQRLSRLIGLDQQNSRRLNQLNEKIAKSRKSLEALDQRIEKAKSADTRITALLEARRMAYSGIFEAICDLEQQLSLLYLPLQRSLSGQGGSIGKLGVLVRRQVDLKSWTEVGEELLDLRRSGPFKGRGTLFDAASAVLLEPWRSGAPEAVSFAMRTFIDKHEGDLKAHRPDGAEPRPWAASVSSWLHETSHIEVSYALTYDGVEIERLSPGTRGIVLLLLYLAIDEEDDRPLIIDQPEENLDPKSVYDELVERFRSAKTRRQVIIVTHNANLVVNTDADQVIVASAGDHEPGTLPKITYRSGGLEDPAIRRHVCDVLEGGERAFRARAKRLRLKFSEAVAEQVSVQSDE